jgi:hypothetical protein
MKIEKKGKCVEFSVFLRILLYENYFLRFFVNIKGIQISFIITCFLRKMTEKNGKIVFLKHHLLNGGFPSVKEIQLC